MDDAVAAKDTGAKVKAELRYESVGNSQERLFDHNKQMKKTFQALSARQSREELEQIIAE